MAKVRVKWASSRYGLDRYVSGQLPLLKAAAERIATECGDGYEARSVKQSGGGGGRASVVTVSAKAMAAEAKQHNLARHAGGRR